MNVTCTLCQSVVDLVAAEASVANASTVAISIAVSALSSAIGGPIVAKECHFILKNIDKVVKWVASGATQKSVCVKLGLCKCHDSSPDETGACRVRRECDYCTCSACENYDQCDNHLCELYACPKKC